MHNDCPTINKIARGHAFEKHVIRKKEFDDLNITTEQEFSDLLHDVMSNPTHSGQLANGRSYSYDESRNILIVKDPNHRDLGTAFRPDRGLDYVLNSLR